MTTHHDASWRISRAERKNRDARPDVGADAALDKMKRCVGDSRGCTLHASACRSPDFTSTVPQQTPPSVTNLTPNLTSNLTPILPPPNLTNTTSKAPPTSTTTDVFYDVARDPLILLSVVGSLTRRQGNWTEQGDLRLILTYWRYLLHPHREPINSLVIDGRRAKHRSTTRRRTRSPARPSPW